MTYPARDLAQLLDARYRWLWEQESFRNNELLAELSRPPPVQWGLLACALVTGLAGGVALCVAAPL